MDQYFAFQHSRDEQAFLFCIQVEVSRACNHRHGYLGGCFTAKVYLFYNTSRMAHCYPVRYYQGVRIQLFQSVKAAVNIADLFVHGVLIFPTDYTDLAARYILKKEMAGVQLFAGLIVVKTVCSLQIYYRSGFEGSKRSSLR